MNEVSEIIDYLLDNSGFSYDTEVPEKLFEKEKESLHLTDRTQLPIFTLRLRVTEIAGREEAFT